MEQHILLIKTNGRGLIDITDEVGQLIDGDTGLCFLFVQHTSASLIVSENSDPKVLIDLEYNMRKLVQDGDSGFSHTLEGPDDMAAHVRSVLTATELTLPIHGGALALGTWQAVYLWEHRLNSSHRKVICTMIYKDG